MEETKVCKCCGKELPISSFSKNGKGILGVCRDCMHKKRQDGRLRKQKANIKRAKYSDPEFDGKTPREVQDILARAARWLNNYGGFTCDVTLRYEKEINLFVH